MLENNRLFRRIQTRNLFRTFSRNYRRPYDLRKLSSQKESQQSIEVSYRSGALLQNSVLQASLGSSLPPASHIQTERIPEKRETAPTFLKTEGDSGAGAPYSHSLNISVQKPSGPESVYLSSLIANRKESSAIVQGALAKRRREDFKLRSCLLKQPENYQADYDESEFSILELTRRKATEIARRTIETTKRDKGTKRGTSTALGCNRRVAAHLFSKYSRSRECPDPFGSAQL